MADQPKPTLYIIDGHAQIYRAYFAVMGLTSPTGEPTNATFGFAAMLLKLLQVRKPTHIIMAMDAPGEVFRSGVDKQYKAQRKPMPEDMPQQIERINQIVSTLDIPILLQPGYEADDVVATLVRQACGSNGKDDCMVYMCSKDKDLDQLINDRVRLFDIQTNEELDAPGLLAKKGYTPDQARDVLALTGDSVDNIPGIPGVGPKTAAKWITQYGNLDQVIAHKNDIPGKIGEAFRTNIALLEQSRILVELIFDVPGIQLNWETARLKSEKLAALAPIFRELGFNKMMTQLEDLVTRYRGEGVKSETPNTNRPAAQSAPAAKSKPAKSPPPIGGLFDQLIDPAPLTDHPTEVTPATLEEAITADHLEETAEENPTHSPSQDNLQPVVGAYILVNTEEKLDDMIATLRLQLLEGRQWLSVDTETDKLGAMRSNLCGISLSAKIATAYYVAVKGAGDLLDPAVVREKLGPFLADESIKKIGQNLKYDLNALRTFGIQLRGIYLDTMVASYVLDSSRLSHGMDALAADLLGLAPIPISDLIGKGAKSISFADVPLDRATHYAAEDADVTLRLAEAMFPKLQASGLDNLCFEVEMPLVKVLADMEFYGVKIDTAILKEMSARLADKLLDLNKRIIAEAGIDFNVDSPRQLGDVLFKQLKLPVIKRTKTGPSTDIEVLERLADQHPVPALIVEQRQLQKLRSTYLEALQQEVNAKTGRVHASFNQTVAATGRLSSSDPNLQNIPIKTEIGREIRRAFVAGSSDHLLITADYSQIELRVLAHYCAEPALLEAFDNNRDVHRVVAAEIFKVREEDVTTQQRGIAKTVNFGIIYGQTGFGLSRVLKIPQQQANEFITAYKKRFPKIDQFNGQCIQDAMSMGYVTTILHRRRSIPDINSPIQSRRQFGQRAAMNSVIQGSAADLIKLAMVAIWAKLEQRNARRPAAAQAKLIMQIHDELVVECLAGEVPEVADMVRAEMENAMKLKVKLKVDLEWGNNWLETK